MLIYQVHSFGECDDAVVVDDDDDDDAIN